MGYNPTVQRLIRVDFLSSASAASLEGRMFCFRNALEALSPLWSVLRSTRFENQRCLTPLVAAQLDLRLIVKPMSAGAVAFRDQFRLRRQPMLHFVPRLRTLVHITEVRFSGYFIRRWRQFDFRTV